MRGLWPVVKLDCSAVLFHSPRDEKNLFEWALGIRGVLRWKQDMLVVRGSRLSAMSLREMLALFYRYGIPMEQLRVFLDERNEIWFTDPKAFWYRSVFGRQRTVSREFFGRAR